MRKDLNKAQFIGYVGKVYESSTMPNGKSVINFSLATTSQWIDKNTGEQREATAWHRVAAFNGLADVISEHVKKGMQLYIEGSLQYNEFTDKNDVVHQGAQIVLSDFQFLGKKN